MNTFVVGQKVWKVSGDYNLPGQVRSGFLTSSGKPRFVVEHDAGMLHIYSPNQIAPWSQDYPYLKLLQACTVGQVAPMRNGDCYRHGPATLKFNLQDGFPLLTTKRLNTKAIAAELMFFATGQTNTKFLHDHGVHIWDLWADANGDLGPIYGAQWRAWTGNSGEKIDQLATVQRALLEDPYSRRHVVNAWNVAALPAMALPPCHMTFQFVVSEDGEHLDLVMFQRSADIFIGVPFNIASYAMLLSLMCAVEGINLKPGTLHMQFGDVHLYDVHYVPAMEQLSRPAKPSPAFTAPTAKNVWDHSVDALCAGLTGYEAHPHIAAPVLK